MNKVSKPCFSCGTEATDWLDSNCDHCYKGSRTKDGEHYTKCRCAIQRDIYTQMFGYGNEAISTRSYATTQLAECPYRVEKQKQYKRKTKKELPLFPND